MYRLVKSFSLSCAHSIPNAGKCARIHGHNYRVRFCVEGKQLDKQDMLIDFREVKHRIEKRYDHQWLNEFAEFDPEQGGGYPTTEKVAEVFFNHIDQLCKQKSNQPRVCWVEVYETDEAYARYEKDEERRDLDVN